MISTASTTAPDNATNCALLPNTTTQNNDHHRDPSMRLHRSSPAIIQTPRVPQPPTPAAGRGPPSSLTPPQPRNHLVPSPSMTVGPSMFQWVKGAQSNAKHPVKHPHRPQPSLLRLREPQVSRIKLIISDIRHLSRDLPSAHWASR